MDGVHVCVCVLIPQQKNKERAFLKMCGGSLKQLCQMIVCEYRDIHLCIKDDVIYVQSF